MGVIEYPIKWEGGGDDYLPTLMRSPLLADIAQT